MAFPASDTHKILATELARVLERARAIRESAASTRSSLAAGPATAEKVLVIAEEAQRNHDWLTAASQIPGIAAYAASNLSPAKTQQEISDAFVNLLAALQAVVTEVTGSFPANGYVNDPPLVDGVRSLKTYSVASTSDLRDDLQTVVDAVDAA